MFDPSIYNYIQSEKIKYETEEIRVGDNWSWNMRRFIQMIFHLKHGVFFTGENDWMRPFKNVMQPILNLAYWTEDLEVKDVVFYIENRMGRVLSFFVKKYHDDVFVKEHNLDTLFDEITESDLDFGGSLVQKTNEPRPETLQLNTIAFCDQTDVLGGPIAFQLNYTPDGLRKMAKNGWGNPENGATSTIEDLISYAEAERTPVGMQYTTTNEVPGKVIEIYIVKGSLPEHYLLDNENMEDFYNQLHVEDLYNKKEGKKQGCTLYRKKSDEGTIKFFTSKKIIGRRLGYGVGESLLHPQIWTNFLSIHKTKMLEAGSKVPLVSDDPNFSNKNQIQDMDNLEITTIQEGRSIKQIPTAAVANIQLYENSINEWFEHAQFSGAAFDPILGKEAASGTTFRGQERTVAQGRGLHDRRRGQRAKFIEEIYRDWIIPDIVKEITKGQEFLATLTAEDMEWVVEQLVDKESMTYVTDKIFSGEVVTEEDRELFKEETRKKFIKGGNKRLLKILKDEFKGVEIKMGINIANKQKDLVNLSDKILSIFQFIFANPAGFQQAMQIPGLSKAFQDILEFSGLNQADFASFAKMIPAQQVQPQTPQQPQQLLQQANPQPA